MELKELILIKSLIPDILTLEERKGKSVGDMISLCCKKLKINQKNFKGFTYANFILHAKLYILTKDL